MQISKVLKTRSKTVKTAVSVYNDAAKKLSKPMLELKSVLDYVRLGQFDLLRLSRHNIYGKATVASSRMRRQQLISSFAGQKRS